MKKKPIIIGTASLAVIAAILWGTWNMRSLPLGKYPVPQPVLTESGPPPHPASAIADATAASLPAGGAAVVTGPSSGQSGSARSASAASPSAASSQDSTASEVKSRPAITHVVKQAYSAPVQQSGEVAVAAAEVGDTRYEGSPNQMGEFPRVEVNAKAVVPVTVSYAQGKPGQVVTAQVIDGGALKAGQAAQLVALNDQGEARFDFTAGDQPGIYRVRLSKGADSKMLNFWVPTN